MIPAEKLVAKYFPGVPLVPTMSTGATDGTEARFVGSNRAAINDKDSGIPPASPIPTLRRARNRETKPGKDSTTGSVQHRGREQQHEHIDAAASAVRLRGAVALRDLRL
jgi:hypothetical protein